MDDDGWIPVVNIKRQRKKAQRERRIEEEKRWGIIVNKCPHVVQPSRARRIQQRLNIDKLYDCLTSPEWINYQIEGWKYVKIVRSGDKGDIPMDTEKDTYSTLSLNNEWGDIALFKLVTTEIGKREIQSNNTTVDEES